jgi:hypothetical protein
MSWVVMSIGICLGAASSFGNGPERYRNGPKRYKTLPIDKLPMDGPGTGPDTLGWKRT